ncbi:MAG: DNA mismatch endonuclease Vsr [Nitrospira sp. LK70]|nr:DNA mismatch endonuclease Vsr [Nitrospira sp. LK70]
MPYLLCSRCESPNVFSNIYNQPIQLVISRSIRRSTVADVFTKAKRSQIMSRIKGKSTSPELRLVRLLKEIGFQLQRHKKQLPGSPDVVLPTIRLAIFVNGCFWHGHKHCARAKLPTTNTMFWRLKIHKNMRRDADQRRKLRKMGWRVLTLWTCKTLTRSGLKSRLRRYLHAKMNK